LSRGWLLEIELKSASSEEAEYSVFAKGWDDNRLYSDEKDYIGELKVNKPNNEYVFIPGGCWSDVNFSKEKMTGSCSEVDANEIWESLPKGHFNWWFSKIWFCAVKACNSESFPKQLMRYQ
jgi:hypothetical protein